MFSDVSGVYDGSDAATFIAASSDYAMVVQETMTLYGTTANVFNDLDVADPKVFEVVPERYNDEIL